MKTAEELLKAEEELFDDIVDGEVSYTIAYNCITNVMIEFAQLHVQAALKAADNEAQVTVVDYDGGGFNSLPEPIYGVDSDSILTAYPLENIK